MPGEKRNRKHKDIPSSQQPVIFSSRDVSLPPQHSPFFNHKCSVSLFWWELGSSQLSVIFSSDSGGILHTGQTCYELKKHKETKKAISRNYQRQNATTVFTHICQSANRVAEVNQWPQITQWEPVFHILLFRKMCMLKPIRKLGCFI